VIRSMSEILEGARKCKKNTIAVVAAEDDDVLKALKVAIDRNIARAILIGNEKKIRKIDEEIHFDLKDIKVIEQSVQQKAVFEALHLFRRGEVDLLMKGSISTGPLLSVLLNKENGVRTDKILSHVAIFEVDCTDRLMYMSDAAINIKPGIKEKVDICKNAIEIAHRLGNVEPRVAVVTPFENVDVDTIPSSIDAALIAKMGDCGQIKGAQVEGPISLDMAVSEKAARVKGYKRPVAGKADIFIVSDIETGNVFYKALIYFVKAKLGGIVAGAQTPIILTSRSDSEETKLLSIASAIMVREGCKDVSNN